MMGTWAKLGQPTRSSLLIQILSGEGHTRQKESWPWALQWLAPEGCWDPGGCRGFFPERDVLAPPCCDLNYPGEILFALCQPELVSDAWNQRQRSLLQFRDRKGCSQWEQWWGTVLRDGEVHWILVWLARYFWPKYCMYKIHYLAANMQSKYAHFIEGENEAQESPITYQSHTGSKWQSWDLNLWLPDPKACVPSCTSSDPPVCSLGQISTSMHFRFLGGKTWMVTAALCPLQGCCEDQRRQGLWKHFEACHTIQILVKAPYC